MDYSWDNFPFRDQLRKSLPALADSLERTLSEQSTFTNDTIKYYANKVRSGDGDVKTLWRIVRALEYEDHPEHFDEGPTPPDVHSVVEMWQEADRHTTASQTAESGVHVKDGPGARKDPTTAPRTLTKTRGMLLDDLHKQQQISVLRLSGRSGQRYVTIPVSHLPCMTPLQDLQRVSTSQLEINSHHKGKAVIVHRIGSLLRRETRTLAAVVDERDEGMYLELIGADQPFYSAALPIGSEFAIKEPYVTTGRDVDVCIRVDHLTDIVRLRELAGVQDMKDSIKWKEEGNKLFRDLQFGDAAAAYEQGLKVCVESAIKRDLHRNLAQAYLPLGFWDRAKEHAENALEGAYDSLMASSKLVQGSRPSAASDSAIEHKPCDAKALYRAGTAAYNLRDYLSAKQAFENLLKLAPQDKDGKRELLKVYKRLNEARTGIYDFEDNLSKTISDQPRVDVATFTRRTTIRASAGKGNGLFAIEDLSIGDLVLCERAFAASFVTKPDGHILRTYDARSGIFSAVSADLWLQTLQEVVKNPSRAQGVLRLGGYYEGLGTQAVVVDGMRAVDSYQVHDIVTRNSFGLPRPATATAGAEPWDLYSSQSDAITIPSNSGLFCHAALINHSCLPNAEKRFIGDLLLVRASRRIRKGEEISLDYVSELDLDPEKRRDIFRWTWHFSCDCRLCQVSAQEDGRTYSLRKKLTDEANKLGQEISQNLPASSGWKARIKRLEKRIDELRATYDLKLYKGLPLKAMTFPLTSLAVIQGTQNNYSKFVATVKEAFGFQGWQSPLDTGGKLLPRPGYETSLDLNIPQLLYIASSAATNAMQLDVAEEIKKLEPQVYLALNGIMRGFKGIEERRKLGV